MNCQECLEELSTASLREMPSDSPVMQHCATCADCSRLTTRLREREYEAATLLNSLPPMSSPLSVAESAAALSNRRRVGQFVVMLSGIAGAIIIWVVGATTILPALKSIPGVEGGGRGDLRTETIALSCLSAEQAADIINPYVRSHGSTYYTPTSGIPAITVRGRPDELARSRDLIAEFEHNPTTVCQNSLAGLKGKLQKLVDTLSLIDVKPVVAPDVAPTTVVTPAPVPAPAKK